MKSWIKRLVAEYVREELKEVQHNLDIWNGQHNASHALLERRQGEHFAYMVKHAQQVEKYLEGFNTLIERQK